MDTGTVTLTTNGHAEFNVGPSNYIYAQAADGLFTAELWRDNKKVESHILQINFTLKNKDFDKIKIVNLHGANNDVRLFYGPGEFDPPGASQVGVTGTVDTNIVSGNVTVNNSQPNDIVPLSDVTVTAAATQIAAADSASLEILVKVPASQAHGVRIGDNTVTNASGYHLEPGESVVLSLQNHAVHAIREAAATANVTVTLTKLSRV